MSQVIVYPKETGVAIVYPTGELPFEEVCRKDVPADIPYRIFAIEDVPVDRETRLAWDVDFSSPDGYGIGADAWFEEKGI